MMHLSNPELWKRIEAYQIDHPGGPFPFSTRLAKENGWLSAHVADAIVEYKKFMYLICVSGEMLTPSPDVDEVWHLHLVYTQEYWQKFCKQVLERDVHHMPADGSETSSGRFRQAYEKTCSLLRSEFGEKPISSIWPVAPIGRPKALTVVDRSRYFVIGKPQAWFAGASGLVSVVAVGAWLAGGIASAPAVGLAFFGFIASAVLFLPIRQSENVSGSCGGACGSDGDGCGGGCGGGD